MEYWFLKCVLIFLWILTSNLINLDIVSLPDEHHIYVHLLTYMAFSYFAASGWCHCVHFCRCFHLNTWFLSIGLSSGKYCWCKWQFSFEEPYHYLLPFLVILCNSHCVVCVRRFCLHIFTNADFFLPVIVLLINMPTSMSHYLILLWRFNSLII